MTTQADLNDIVTPFCPVDGEAQDYENHDHGEWVSATYCDQCGNRYDATDRDPDCVGCGGTE